MGRCVLLTHTGPRSCICDEDCSIRELGLRIEAAEALRREAETREQNLVVAEGKLIEKLLAAEARVEELEGAAELRFEAYEMELKAHRLGSAPIADRALTLREKAEAAWDKATGASDE